MQTDCRPQKRGRGLVGPCSDPLVGPRDPACRDALGAAPHSSCSCDRLVGLATSPSGRRTRSPHQKQTATVMLGMTAVLSADGPGVSSACFLAEAHVPPPVTILPPAGLA